MALRPGTRLGPYEVADLVGAGGMGEVYRARDTKLNRDVAVKVLPEDVASDEARLARFRREAQVLASLNHPNIAAIYELEESDGVAALALELVEGEDLAERLKRGAIPYEEAMAVARELAAGLEAAHEKGIVHRDLKPGNIKLGVDGRVKILDFGLAKAYEGEASSSGDSALSQSPTISRQMTQAGVILGTAAYMSPEQAKGKPVDKRADIWAFGVVLYEMLTGQRLFGGEDLTETLASVVKDQPNLSVVPREVRQLLAKCLERDPKHRLRDIGDAWALLDDGAEAVTTAPPRLPWIVAAVATFVAVGALAGWMSSRRANETRAIPIRFHIERPESDVSNLVDRNYFQLSPDGRFIALVEGDRLWVRSLDAFDARALEGTNGATYPFWSPDATSIGFFAEGQLKKISLSSGVVQTLCEVSGGRGGTWGPDGTILFSPEVGTKGIFRVSEQGGTPEAVTSLGPTAGDEDVHRYPQFLPDGERFLFMHLTGDTEAAGIYVGALDGSAPVRVLDGDENALYAPPAAPGENGHLVFRRQGTLMAQPIDLGPLQTVGAMFRVAEDAARAGNTGYSALSVATNGMLAYASGGANATVELVWRDRAGKRAGVVTAAAGRYFSLSPDAQAVAFPSTEGATFPDVWIQDMSGGAPSRFTFGPRPGWAHPLWSPAGDELVFATPDIAGLGEYEIRRKRYDMTGTDELVARSDELVYLWDWSPDGKTLLYSPQARDIWTISLEDGTPAPLIVAPGLQLDAQFSPDGRWISYTSAEYGAPQIYVQPYPPSGAFWQISTDGGAMPRWRSDGEELFYRSPGGTLMAVPITARDGAGGASASLVYGTAESLFDGVPAPPLYGSTYETASNGQRFLVGAPVAGAKPPITVLLNWQASVGN